MSIIIEGVSYRGHYDGSRLICIYDIGAIDHIQKLKQQSTIFPIIIDNNISVLITILSVNVNILESGKRFVNFVFDTADISPWSK